VGVLALLNVRQRRSEIGILRALGYGSGRIAGLFLVKAVLAGLLGAGIGFGLGTWLALVYGPEVFRVTASKIQPEWAVLAWLLIAAPALAALATLIPAMVAVAEDPAVTLREE
jgi:putative ABC transport system permease protein